MTERRTDAIKILRNVTLGQRTAEEEGDELAAYFVETDEWRRIYAGEVDVVYGAKGSGKSAIYALLLRRIDPLFDRGVLLVPAENVRGALVFQDLVADPPSSEEEIVSLWRLYFITLVGHTLQDMGIGGRSTKKLLEHLDEARLLPAGSWSLRKGLRAVRTYLGHLAKVKGIEGGVQIDALTGAPAGFTGKILFSEPSEELRQKGFVSANDLLQLADDALEEADLELWIALDRLDVAFAASADLERNALRALFRVYLDLLGLERISLKIFLRDDVWRRISGGGFREASHITRAITIRWNRTNLLNLVIRRLVQNESIQTAYDVNPMVVLDDVDAQEKLFYRIFPDQVDVGPNKPSAFDWMLSRVVDGTRQNVPRELIHLLSEARRIQLERFEIGYDEPEGETLFERVTFRDALPEVSTVRLERTVYAEYPEVKSWLEALEGEKTEQFPETLASIWGSPEGEALERAERLVQIGFFERRGAKLEPSFWVPFLYRPSLDLSQGSAR
jgi:hypothetical protein